MSREPTGIDSLEARGNIEVSEANPSQLGGILSNKDERHPPLVTNKKCPRTTAYLLS